MGTTLNNEIDLTLMDQVFDKYAGQRGVLIPILQAAQSAYSYLPAEVLQLIADRLGTSLGRVYGVATFYAQFYLERRGKHILKLCDGTACHVKGTSILLTAVEDEFGISPGETSDDGELTVEIVYCLGSCALAPVAVVDEQVVGRVRKDILLQRVKRRIEDAQASAGALV
jgi:NADH-quinone oxidoreductase subunit E